MSIESILIVLFYSAKPYLWLIIALVLIPIICYIIKLNSPIFSNSQTLLISLAIGVLVALAAPYITVSKLEYVSTMADWGALIGILVGVAIYCWITLMLLFKGRA